ncbi:MAG: hypothetical protein RBS68_05920 [Anaerolineales bacterium]|jgi:hypothetical protein|nr:hypothetical protein [Anaerolineales bacterium]
MTARSKSANNRNRYACINVDHDTYQVIRALARAYRRSLLEQVKVMAANERKKASEYQPLPGLEAK